MKLSASQTLCSDPQVSRLRRSFTPQVNCGYSGVATESHFARLREHFQKEHALGSLTSLCRKRGFGRSRLASDGCHSEIFHVAEHKSRLALKSCMLTSLFQPEKLTRSPGARQTHIHPTGKTVEHTLPAVPRKRSRAYSNTSR